MARGDAKYRHFNLGIASSHKWGYIALVMTDLYCVSTPI